MHIPRAYNLSTRFVIIWMADNGHTNDFIAFMNGVSERTVRSYKKGLLERGNLVNDYDNCRSLAKAIKSGELDILLATVENLFKGARDIHNSLGLVFSI